MLYLNKLSIKFNKIWVLCKLCCLAKKLPLIWRVVMCIDNEFVCSSTCIQHEPRIDTFNGSVQSKSPQLIGITKNSVKESTKNYSWNELCSEIENLLTKEKRREKEMREWWEKRTYNKGLSFCRKRMTGVPGSRCL
jgi:hypothetical protein